MLFFAGLDEVFLPCEDLGRLFPDPVLTISCLPLMSPEELPDEALEEKNLSIPRFGAAPLALFFD